MLHQPAQGHRPKPAAWALIHQWIVDGRKHMLVHTLLRPESLLAELALPQIVIIVETARWLLTSHPGTKPIVVTGGHVPLRLRAFLDVEVQLVFVRAAGAGFEVDEHGRVGWEEAGAADTFDVRRFVDDVVLND